MIKGGCQSYTKAAPQQSWYDLTLVFLKFYAPNDTIHYFFFQAVYFTIEYVIRFACAPQKIKFFIQPLNLVDLFAILPYIFSFVLDHLSEFHIIGKAGKVVRLVRVTRILRVFKLVRHFAGLQSLFATLKQAHRELGLLVMLVGVSVLTFSSLVYFAEKDEQNWTFVDSFWWGLLTITTVGYGKLLVYVLLEANHS